MTPANLFKSVHVYAVLSIALLAACTAPHKTQVAKNNSVQEDSLKNKTVERPVYHGSVTRLMEIIHTKLEVKFDWDKAYLYGKATLTARPYYYSTDSVFLNARGMDIHEVSLLQGEGKKALNYSYANDIIRIKLDGLRTRTDTFRLFIDYTSKPNERKQSGGSAAITDDKGLYFINPDGADKTKPRQIWTQGETQSNSVWFPCIDSPNEKMTDEIYMTVDKKYTTLSNGELVYQKDNADGTRTDYWKMDLPHSTYLVMMAVGEFAVVKDKWRDREVNYYVEPEFEPSARAIFGHTPEMMETFSNLLGVPYVWNKYSQIVVRDYVSGAMENTTATLHGEFLNQTLRELIDKDYEDVVSHELFHHWFGDLVTCESWSNIPLNESFADYGEYLWLEHKYGRDAADAHRKAAIDKYMKSARRKQVDLVRYNYGDQEELFDAVTYEKGGSILHMLRKYVGDEAFFASLKLYLETYKFGNAEVANLRMAFEKVTGEDLNWFFNEWFFASGHPDLDIRHNYNDTTHKYTVSFEQKQDFKTTPLYKLPLDIDIYSNGKKERKRVIIEKQKQDFVFDARVRPDLVNVDAEKMLLCIKTETGKTNKELAFQFHNAPLYPDRTEALFGLLNDLKSPEYLECLVTALDDKYWELRLLAISGLSDVVVGHEKMIKEKLMKIAGTDPKSLVRAEAITVLSRNFKNADLISFYKGALKDQSYAVMGNALVAIDKLDSMQSAKIAKGLEGEKNEQLITTVLYIYSRSGSDENLDFFIQAVDQFKSYSKITYASLLGDFLKRCKDESVNKALPVLETLCKDSNKYVKFYGKKTIQDLSDMYEKREKSGVAGAGLQKMKMDDFLKTLE